MVFRIGATAPSPYALTLHRKSASRRKRTYMAEKQPRGWGPNLRAVTSY